MKKGIIGLSVASLLAGVTGLAVTNDSEVVQVAQASDHDDGENADKERALNLTDHFSFRSPGDPSKLSLVMYFNPRSLPGRQYNMAAGARYEFHVTKIADKTAAATGKDDFVFRFVAGAPNASGVQAITLTVLKDMGGTLTEVGTHSGNSTAFASSQANAVTTNTMAGVGGVDVQWFVGQRADSFVFDVNRFFEVRAFLAKRFFGGAGGNGDPTAGLSANCRGDNFLSNIVGGETAPSDGDVINLFNPPSCAPDFTKGLNVTAIVLNVPIAQLGGTVFDTWSTISVEK